jgi:hypothetical protein
VKHWSRLDRLLALVVVAAIVFYSLLLRISVNAGIEPIAVIRDLSQTCKTPIGVGLMPNLGVLMWMAAAAVPLFAVGSGLVGQPRWRRLLLLGGALSLLLTVDDFLLLHDRYIGPTFLYLLYAVLAIWILFGFRDLLVESGGVLIFFSAAVFLGTSVILDELQELLPAGYEQVQFFEEGAKFIGIACWLLFWWQASAFAARLRASR